MSKRWYVVHAYSGFEKSVQRALIDRITRAGMQDKFGQILVPVEEVVEMKNGQKTASPSASSSPAMCSSRWT
jgi:transcriptional antiterminator NusG